MTGLDTCFTESATAFGVKDSRRLSADCYALQLGVGWFEPES
jgi:hypothetical protein